MRKIKLSQVYKWDGEPVQVEHVDIIVKEHKQKPLYWWNYEVSLTGASATNKAVISSLKITAKDGEVFYISNHFGIGLNKLRKGGMWTQASYHFDEEYIVKIQGAIHRNIKFRLDKYEEYEKGRLKWRKELEERLNEY